MKTRRAFHALSVLLIIALLCGVFPAAYAEGGNVTDVVWAEPANGKAPEGVIELPEIALEAPAAAPAEAEEPALSREETMLSFLRLVMQAEKTQDPLERAALCREAEALWNDYLETAPTGSAAFESALAGDVDKLERQDMLYDLMQYIMAAETEPDPAVRASYYLQADAIWYSYLGLVNSAVKAEEPDPARERALEEFLRGMADPNMDPADQERFLEEAAKLWDTYYDMVLEAMEANKPAEEPKPAEVPKPADEEPKDEPHVESYTFYANSWEELEDMFSDILNGTMTVDPNETPIGLPNPWIETMWLEEAELVSGVSFSLPEKALPQGMKLMSYRAMEGTIEADYSDGENELMIRASVADEGFTLSGDYNSYSKEWTEKLGELTVDCLGDGKTVNVASYKSGDVAVAVTMACGLEGQGLTRDELSAIVENLETKAPKHLNPMGAYADPWSAWDDFFSGPFGPFMGAYGGHGNFSDGQTEDSAPAQTTPKTGTETKTGSEPKTGTETRPGHSHRDRGGNYYGPGFYYGYGYYNN